MLDEQEYQIIHQLIWEGMTRRGEPMAERFAPALQAYERMTGFHCGNVNEIGHHRISIYGDPCGQCGKPLRTPNARYCAACGWRPETNTVLEGS